MVGLLERTFGANQNGREGGKEGECEKVGERARRSEMEKITRSRHTGRRERVQSLLFYLVPFLFRLALRLSFSLSLSLSSSPSLLSSLSLSSMYTTFLPSVRREERLPILRQGQDRDFNQLARFLGPGK